MTLRCASGAVSSPSAFKRQGVLFPTAEAVLTDLPPEILALIASSLLLVDVRATRLQRVAHAFFEPVALAVRSCPVAWWTGSGPPVSLPPSMAEEEFATPPPGGWDLKGLGILGLDSTDLENVLLKEV